VWAAADMTVCSCLSATDASSINRTCQTLSSCVSLLLNMQQLPPVPCERPELWELLSQLQQATIRQHPGINSSNMELLQLLQRLQVTKVKIVEVAALRIGSTTAMQVAD